MYILKYLTNQPIINLNYLFIYLKHIFSGWSQSLEQHKYIYEGKIWFYLLSNHFNSANRNDNLINKNSKE